MKVIESETVNLKRALSCGAFIPKGPSGVNAERVSFTVAQLDAYTNLVKQEQLDSMQLLQDAFRAGWETSADWIQTSYLVDDIGSPAYLKAMANALTIVVEQSEIRLDKI